MKEGNDTSGFYKLIKKFSDVEKPAQWSPNMLFPGKTEAEITELVADFFNEISTQFAPLDPVDGGTHGEWTLQRSEVSKMLRTCKKPRSKVAGDIFPHLVTRYSELLATPLTRIYNEVLRTGAWPKSWKNETVIIIPKKTKPDSLGQCRNLSCTPLCLLYTSPSPRDRQKSRMPSSA